ncbi:hypothetical protein NE237_024183 [Protea cynaroides]|uniref:Jacalin-type lectin domain-containing protein n=1 Tax=Protea cynaroides TaxID=273540 RepID=A0A9Q0HE68_9MAGN|nr:hypothetical protein NE237_024183 [Protea cynaroides]
MEMMAMVGPQGGRFGWIWDDKGAGMLTHILISYESGGINSIQTAYVLDGKLQLSDKHGGNGKIFKTVQMDYPFEFLTGIRGFTASSSTGDDIGLNCLTFVTNLRNFGPFGLEKGNAFSIEMATNRCFGGFHGRSDSNYIYSIGVYVQMDYIPLEFLTGIRGFTASSPDDDIVLKRLRRENQRPGLGRKEASRRKREDASARSNSPAEEREKKHQLEAPKKQRMETMKVGPHGGIWGESWDDKGKNLLTHIFISYESGCINSIQTAYVIGTKSYQSEKHGGSGKIFKTVELDYPTEFLTGISGFIADDDDIGLKCLTFETNLRKIGPFGNEEGTAFNIQMGTKRCFGGFHGSSDSNYIYSIGVYFTPINPVQLISIDDEFMDNLISDDLDEY